MNRNSLWWGPPKKFSVDIQQRKISWLELFYDLVYVIAFSRITQHFATHCNFEGLVYYVYLFGMIWWGWINGSMYYDLHGTPGMRTNFTTLWQMLVVAALAVVINLDHDTNYIYLTVILATMQFYITYLWWSVGIYDKEHRRLNIPFTVFYLTGFMLLILSIYIPSPYKSILFWLILLINNLPGVFIYKIMRKKRQAELNLSPSMAERLGLFTIIVFGEVILGVINGMRLSDGHSRRIWLGFSLGILIVFSMWLIFFSLIADRDCKPGFMRGQYFQLLFVPTLLSIGIIGASFSVLLPALNNNVQTIPENIRWYFGFSFSLFLICVFGITRFLVYEQKYGDPKKLFILLLIVPAVLISAITVLFQHISLMRYLLLIFSVMVLIITGIIYSWNKTEKEILSADPFA